MNAFLVSPLWFTKNNLIQTVPSYNSFVYVNIVKNLSTQLDFSSQKRSCINLIEIIVYKYMVVMKSIF